MHAAPEAWFLLLLRITAHMLPKMKEAGRNEVKLYMHHMR